MYAVYRQPRDFPDEFVVRRWYIDRVEQGEPFARGPSLEAVRAALPPGLFNLGRNSLDDPVIAEVWV
jgi:hypothetical protein